MNSNASLAAERTERRFPSVEEFEAGTLNPEAFDHAAHIYVAWQLLQENAPVQATGRFLCALKRLTRALGMESKYHETISCFYMAIIAERRMEKPGQGWEAFVDSNPDLLGPPAKLLEKYYSPEKLGSDLAKRQFLLPDV